MELFLRLRRVSSVRLARISGSPIRPERPRPEREMETTRLLMHWRPNHEELLTEHCSPDQLAAKGGLLKACLSAMSAYYSSLRYRSSLSLRTSLQKTKRKMMKQLKYKQSLMDVIMFIVETGGSMCVSYNALCSREVK